MTERAAHLADHVVFDVPIRQAGVPDARTVRVGAEWVLTLPHRVRDVLADGRLRFHAAPELDSADVADVLVAASMQGRVALGGTLGTLPRRVGQISVNRNVPEPGMRHARWEGVDLHAAVRVPAGQRDRLERVCRYALRPPVAGARLPLTADGQVVLHLRHPWGDGTTHLAFTPTAFLERLAVLVPRGAPAATGAPHVDEPDSGGAPSGVTRRSGARGASWAALMRRALRLIALIESSSVARRILTHLGLPADVPAPARAPPTGDDDEWPRSSSPASGSGAWQRGVGGANPRVPRQQAAKNGPAVGRPQFDNGDSVIPRPC